MVLSAHRHIRFSDSAFRLEIDTSPAFWLLLGVSVGVETEQSVEPIRLPQYFKGKKLPGQDSPLPLLGWDR
jgi:hypothetical protein